jgi:hypothetical protein
MGPAFVLHLFSQQPPNNSSDVYSTQDELHCGVVGHALAELGYISGNGELSLFGKALSQVDSVAYGEGYQDELLLVLELLRRNAITATKLGMLPHRISCKAFPHEKEVLLLSRVFSILSMKFYKDKTWEGEIDHDLMGFNSITKSMSRSLRNLFEMQLLNIFLRHKSNIPYNQYAHLSIRLPFYEESNTGLGIVLKAFLVDGCRDPSVLTAHFPSCPDPYADLQRGIHFWNQIMKMLRILGGQISSQILNEFETADSYLKSLI